MSMHDDIWYEPVMPTLKEQRMMAAARQRIREKQKLKLSQPSGADDISIPGLITAGLTFAAIAILSYVLITLAAF